mgnify:CR=1 FL=1
MDKVDFWYPGAIGGLAAIIGAYGSTDILWPFLAGFVTSGLVSLFLIKSDRSPFLASEKLKVYSPAGSAGGFAGAVVAIDGFTETGFTGIGLGVISGWLIGLLVPAIGAIAIKEGAADQGVSNTESYSDIAKNRQRPTGSNVKNRLNVVNLAEQIFANASVDDLNALCDGFNEQEVENIVNECSRGGDFLVHIAIKQKRLDILAWLLKKGACPDKKNPQGLTAKSLAENMRWDAASLLIDRN